MRVFCDTSVLVAACLKSHPDHLPAHAVLTRIPVTPKLEPEDALAFLENEIIPYFRFMALGAEDYPPAIRDLTAKGLGGGRIYDLLHLRVASKIALDRIYTFNQNEWKTLAPELAPLIVGPALPP